MKNNVRFGFVGLLLVMIGVCDLFAKKNNYDCGVLFCHEKWEGEDLFREEFPSSFTVNITIYSFYGNYDISCFGVEDGKFEATAFGGGVDLLSFQWSNNLGTDPVQEGVGAGTYMVTVVGTLANGTTCEVIDSVTLVEPPELGVEIIEQTDTGCSGSSDGSVEIEVTGGTGNYWYTWSGPTPVGNTSEASNLAVGIYDVMTTDGNNCTITTSVTIGESTVIQLGTTNIMHANCHDSNNGAATIEVEGAATDSYTFDWPDNPGNDATKTNLGQGEYVVTVTDANMCSGTITVNITAPDELLFWLENQNPISCPGSSDGSATIAGNGGTEPYEYFWSSGGTGLEETELSANTYTVIITDTNDCSTTTSVTINPLTPITINPTVTSVTCSGDSDGSATIYPDGGSGGFTYSWSSSGTEATENNLAAGDYIVTVTDSNDCSTIDTITISFPEPLIATIVDIFPTSCHGYSDGRATAFGMGGTGGKTYLWSNGETGATAITLSVGIYSVTTTDDKGCTFIVDNIAITEPDPITINFDITNIPCEDGGIGEIEAVVEGGTEPYDIFWTAGQVGEMAIYETPGEYGVFISDDNACTETANAMLPLNSIGGLTSYPDAAVFQNGEAQDLDYASGIPTMTWEVLETDNIDTGDPAFETGGLATNSLNLSFVLEEQRTTGFVLLEVYPQGGLCVGDTVQTRVRVLPGEDPVFAPEIFSPNNDGFNDVWEVTFPVTESPSNYSVVVYGKNGQKVYESTALNQLWRGEGCPDGAYYYIIEDKKNETQYRGAVSILR